MNGKFVLGVVGAMAIGFSAPAMAEVLNVASAPGSLVTYTTAFDSVAFTGDGSVNIGASGVFAPLGPCTNCVTPADFNSGSGPITVFTITEAPGATVHLTSYTFAEGPMASLDIFGSGTATVDGGAPVDITFAFSTQEPPGGTVGTEVSWSATIDEVPLPGALPLFASGLLGFWGWTRRRKITAKLGA